MFRRGRVVPRCCARAHIHTTMRGEACASYGGKSIPVKNCLQEEHEISFAGGGLWHMYVYCARVKTNFVPSQKTVKWIKTSSNKAEPFLFILYFFFIFIPSFSSPCVLFPSSSSLLLSFPSFLYFFLSATRTQSRHKHEELTKLPVPFLHPDL